MPHNKSVLYVSSIISHHIESLRQSERRERLSVEATHELRVSSRRLDASLQVFKPFFPKKQLKRWRKDLRAVVKLLGELRDLDVLVQFLKKRRERNVAGIIKDFESRRGPLERKAVQGLKRFSRTRALAGISARLGGAKLTITEGKLTKVGRRAIRRELREVNALGKSAEKHGRSDQLHELRLALKELRYTLEIFDRWYEGRLEKFIDHCAKLQTHLGDIHDQEIWLGDKKLRRLERPLKAMVKKNRRKFKKAWQKGMKKKVLPSLERLLRMD